MILLIVIRWFVIFIVKQEAGLFIAFLFAFFDVTTRLVAAIVTIVNAIAEPLIGNASLVAYAFELVIVTELTIVFVFSA